MGGKDGKLYLLSAASGEMTGTFEAGGPVLSGVSVAGPLFLFGCDDQYLYAYDTSIDPPPGRRRWRVKGKGKVRVSAGATAGRVYFGSEDSLYAVELD